MKSILVFIEDFLCSVKITAIQRLMNFRDNISAG